MMKRFISIFLILFTTIFLFGFSSSKNYYTLNLGTYLSNEAEIEGIDRPINQQFEVRDLSDNIFYIQVGETEGFMVFDPISYTFIEKSATFISPYDFSSNREYYYFGPLNYYERKGDLFYALGNESKVVDLNYAYEMQKIFDSQLLVSRKNKNLDAKNYIESGLTRKSVMPTAIKKTYIDNYQYIRDAKHLLIMMVLVDL